jgi:hypothetical protein
MKEASLNALKPESAQDERDGTDRNCWPDDTKAKVAGKE